MVGLAALRIERINPNYLETYAKYVVSKDYTPEYLDKARKEIPKICEILFKELYTDGRLGACIDASMVLSRILEKEGYWNYIVKGSLAIDFPPELNIETKYFWTYDHGNFSSAHSWVYAPPFNVIDITVKQQGYSMGESKHLPNFVITEDFNEFTVSYKALISPEVRLYLRNQGIRNSEMLSHVEPRLPIFWKSFKPNLVEASNVKLQYIPVAMGAPEEKSEKITSLKLNNRYGIDIYNQLVKPKLAAIRS